MLDNICYSGGCHGADQIFGEEAEKVGHEVVHFSFSNHHIDKKCNKEKVHILSAGHLQLADQHLKIAAKFLGRTTGSNLYVQNLLRRNYYQIKDTQNVFAVCNIDEKGIPQGGTGWAVAMAMNAPQKPGIFVYDDKRHEWFKHTPLDPTFYRWVDPDFSDFWKQVSISHPFGKYTGIGSREITPEGEQAIRDLY